jgi:hypothetical protein
VAYLVLPFSRREESNGWFCFGFFFALDLGGHLIPFIPKQKMKLKIIIKKKSTLDYKGPNGH